MTADPFRLTRCRRVAIACLCLALVVAGCGGDDESASGSGGDAAGSSEPVALKLGWQPAPFPWLYLANEQELWKDSGVDVELVKFTAGPPMFAALQSGSIDVAYMGAGAIASAAASGIDLRVLLMVEEVDFINGVVVRDEANVDEVAQLKGKSVGVVPGSTSDIGLRQALEGAGLSEEDVDIIKLQPPAVMPAFDNGDVDAIAMWPPVSVQAQQEGGSLLVSNGELGIRAPGVLAARAEWLEENPEAAARLIETMDGASQAYDADPAAAVDLMAEQMGVDPSVAEAINEEANYPSPLEQLSNEEYPVLVSETGDDLVAKLQEIADFLYENEFVEEQVDASSIVDPEPLRAYLDGRAR